MIVVRSARRIGLRLFLAAGIGILAAMVSCWGAPNTAGTAGTPLETVDLGEGIFATEPEFDFKDQATATARLMSCLEGTEDMVKHLRAIRDFARCSEAAGDAVPPLRDVLVRLKASNRIQAQIEIAFIMGWLIGDDSKDAKPQYLKDLAPLLSSIRLNQSDNPWARLVAAMLFAAYPELKGNAFDEALYAMCYGYDDALVQLASGSLLLGMDLSYGGNERLQWFVYLAFCRAKDLAPANSALKSRIKESIANNVSVPGYRSSRWIRALS